MKCKLLTLGLSLFTQEVHSYIHIDLRKTNTLYTLQIKLPFPQQIDSIDQWIVVWATVSISAL